MIRIFIFYNNLSSGGVTHSGDNRTGEARAMMKPSPSSLKRFPAMWRKIVVTVTIYDAQARGQNFGQVANAFVRLVDKQTGVELLRYDLGEDYSTETAIVFARSTATTANGSSLRWLRLQRRLGGPCAVNTV